MNTKGAHDCLATCTAHARGDNRVYRQVVHSGKRTLNRVDRITILRTCSIYIGGPQRPHELGVGIVTTGTRVSPIVGCLVSQVRATGAGTGT